MTMSYFLRLFRKGESIPMEIDSEEFNEASVQIGGEGNLNWHDAIAFVQCFDGRVELLDADSNDILCSVEAGQLEGSLVFCVSPSYYLPLTGNMWEEHDI
jgi:hypothetical protein